MFSKSTSRFALVALLATLMPHLSLASSTTVLGVSGSWYNPEFSGEGLAIEQFEGGRVVAYWYTYDDIGNQVWTAGSGRLDGNIVDIRTYTPVGGGFMSPLNPTNVDRVPWGTITLVLESCNSIDMTFAREDGLEGGYALSRVLGTALEEGACTEAPPPVAELQKCGFMGCDPTSVPFNGTASVSITSVGGDDRLDLYEFRLTATEGDLWISRALATDTTGDTQPSVTGLEEGMVILQGETVSFKLTALKTGGQTVQLNYIVELEDLGTLIDLDVTFQSN